MGAAAGAPGWTVTVAVPAPNAPEMASVAVQSSEKLESWLPVFVTRVL